MREAASIVLHLIRYANRHGIELSDSLRLLTRDLQITREEREEIGELIKADIREANAMQPFYGDINEILSRMSTDNPFGI